MDDVVSALTRVFNMICRSTMVIVLAALAFIVPCAPLLAATAGGATIHNVVTVSYDSIILTASQNVTVQTLAAGPTIRVDSTAQIIAPSTNATYTYTLANNANGVDSYLLAATSVDVGVTGAPSINLNGTATPNSSITLAGTLTSAASDAAGNVYIPAGSESGLAINDTLVVSGVGTYTVNSLTPGTAANTLAGVTTAELPTVLTLTPVGAVPAIGAGTIPTGTQMGEQTDITLLITASAPSVAGVDGSHRINLTVTTTATDLAAATLVSNTSAATGTETITTVTLTSVIFTKEVRNVTKGTVFATSGITLESGDVLEYRITATPTPGGGDVSSSVLIDEVPTNTTYVAASTLLNAGVVTDGAGSTLATTTASGGLSIKTASGATGVLVDGESAVVLFRVLVD